MRQFDAVIVGAGFGGIGSTGVQLIPELANEVSELTVYQRTPIWVLPKLDFGFTPAVQLLFARVPLARRAHWWSTDIFMDLMVVIAILEIPVLQVPSTGPRHAG
jgi:cation diffusion facilitator CzcD-associated flavoprotein CzcO